MAYPSTLVFVHGWSVSHTDTYGGLPERLAAEAAGRGRNLQVRDLRLSKYVSFHDEVRLRDLARAMESAVRTEFSELLKRGERFAVITHSTGGPLARQWWWDFYASQRGAAACPMSHLVMLAPANFGSALAQLGKSRLSRLKSWTSGVEPGAGVLDWLEHGSPESWALNESWIRGRFGKADARGTFCFVLTGQCIDRRLYDHLNSYTGECGSDGVVRVAAANLNASLVRLEQGRGDEGDQLKPVGRVLRAPRTAFRLISGAAHSGAEIGIMRSVEPRTGGRGQEVVESILRCLEVGTPADYRGLTDEFELETAAIQAKEQVEIEPIPILPDRAYVHDRTSLVIFRLCDNAGHPVLDFDLELTGAHDDPDLLPEGFFKDRQRNQRARNVLTYFFNYDLMAGSHPIPDPRYPGQWLRQESPGVDRLGLKLNPRPNSGFVQYAPCAIQAAPKLLEAVVRPNETTLVEVVLRRWVARNVFELDPGDARRTDFLKIKPGDVFGD